MIADELLNKIKKYKYSRRTLMEEKIKLLEMQIQVLQGTVNKMDQALGLVFSVLVAHKAIYDQLQFNKPEASLVKPEEKK